MYGRCQASTVQGTSDGEEVKKPMERPIHFNAPSRTIPPVELESSSTWGLLRSLPRTWIMFRLAFSRQKDPS